jgi:hypothetical protein
VGLGYQKEILPPARRVSLRGIHSVQGFQLTHPTSWRFEMLLAEEAEVWVQSPLPEYEVSSLGRVMRIPFAGPMPGGGTRMYGGKPHYGAWNKKQRRYQIVVSPRGERRPVRAKNHHVNRLVCETFHGPPPFDGAAAIHIDENPRNNRADNLKWGTMEERHNYPKHLAYCRARTGNNSPWHKHIAKQTG